MNQDIAIIGLAGRFPCANNIQEYYRNLKEGRDCVVEVSAQRFCDATFPLGPERLQPMGLLEQIDRFDRKFFNISVREAQEMDPHQRISLELAYAALEDSGYSPAAFAGTKMAVIATNADYQYLRNFEVLEPTMYSGNSQFSIAGRVSRFFNTKGPAFIVDTGCSSGLLAVSLGCDQLHLGKADTALVFGVRVVLEPLPVDLDVDVGITSTDGKTRSFNADSNGSGSSEAAAAVLLKPLAQAVADGDHVYAVIRSTAVNSSAQSSASLTATSSVAQSEMLIEAWERAGIEPSTVGYIEAHGSGTKLGDPIEIGGIDLAFRQYTDRKKICAVASVKSNIGHTDKLAGLSGLLKTVLSLQKAELFPSLHFDRPNPLIDFENSATYIQTKLQPWVRPKGAPRRAGVNSFGFSGNNVHVVLEEAVAPLVRSKAEADVGDSAAARVITLSSKRAAGLDENRVALLRFLEEEPATELADIAFTLNTGREHFRFRHAFLARDTADLITQLRQARSDWVEAEARSRVETVFVFSGDVVVDDEVVVRLARQFPVFATHHAACLAQGATAASSEALQRFAFQYALCHLLADLGVAAANFVGTGSGDLVVRVVAGDLDLAEGIRMCGELTGSSERDLTARLSTLVEQATAENPAVFVEMGATGSLSHGLQRLSLPGYRDRYDVLTFDVASRDAVPLLLQGLYRSGVELDWVAAHRSKDGRRISLPGYQFEKIRCWFRPPHSMDVYREWHRRTQVGAASGLAPVVSSSSQPLAEIVELKVDESWSPTERKVARIWMEVLKLDQVGLDDDFFKLGGHSLFGTMVRNRIEKDFQLRLEFRDIFVHSKIRTLAQSIDRLLATGVRAPREESIPIEAAAAHYPASPAQRLLWRLERTEGALHTAYNVPVVIRLNGKLDADRLERAVIEVIARHEALRTHFVEIDGEPRQVVVAGGDFRLDRREAASNNEVVAAIDALIRPFELTSPPLIRGALIRAGEQAHVLALDIHHALFDGSSLAPLFRELSTLYAGGSLPALPRSYKDYAAWRVASLAGPSMREAEAFWLRRFGAGVPTLALPTDFPRPVAPSHEGALWQTTFVPELAANVRALGQQEGSTLFMVLLAAYSVLLSKLARQDDIVVGSSVAGRTHADLEPLIGMFVNTLAFRNTTSDTLTFREFLARVRDDCIQTYKHQAYPLESLLAKLPHRRDASRGPLFDTMLVLQNMDLGEATFAEGLQVAPVEFARRSSKYDLTFEFYEVPEGLMLNVEYCLALFTLKTVQGMAAAMQQVLSAVCANPAIRLADIAVTPASAKVAEASVST